MRFAREGSLPIVWKSDSWSVVALARQKPVWVGSEAEGLRVSAESVFAAACAMYQY
jgi:hypothetical protein